ncbi:hypothetical protein PILCRDRAFT_87864 [Piloderma croceum F 1598]|uniref:MYND-type domain-containing protein n=1 Tax=Piloderma croceum (strain F 1598) TaxID=765440 RepID=A0A0C3FWN7_PILCF|nr:hypothetical protein PILCRDRAFT_87864 [Piloderma croceum F 1598]
MNLYASLSEQKHKVTPYADDRVKWNADWERILETNTTNPLDAARAVVRVITADDEDEFQSELEDHRQIFRSLCVRQNVLTQCATECFAEKDFEEKWLHAEDTVRQDHILEGLGRAYFGNNRIFCEELTLANLQRDGGRGFLRLIDHFMIEDVNSYPSQPIYLPSSRWSLSPEPDSVLTIAEEEYAIGFYNVSRNTLLCEFSVSASHDGILKHHEGEFLYHTLQSFYGVPPKEQTRTLKRGNDHSTKTTKRMEDRVWGRATAKTLRKEYAAERKGHVIACENCRKVQEDLKTKHFMCCTVCKQKMDRKVFYCSRVCQKDDWKHRHKLICGKPLTVQNAEATAVPPPDTPYLAAHRGPAPTEKIGPAVGGFKRSPALSFQINNLDANSINNIDYIFINPAGCPKTVTIHHPLEKSIFREFRNKAFTTGDANAIAALGQFLAKEPGGPVQAVGSGMTREAWTNWIERERLQVLEQK